MGYREYPPSPVRIRRALIKLVSTSDEQFARLPAGEQHALEHACQRAIDELQLAHGDAGAQQS